MNPPSDERPTVRTQPAKLRLHTALMHLSTACMNQRGLEQFAMIRESWSRAKYAEQQARIESCNRQMAELVRAGMSRDDAARQVNFGAFITEDFHGPSPNEKGEYRDELRSRCEDAVAFADQALAAIDEGGAAPVDSSLNPGSTASSMRFRALVREVQNNFRQARLDLAVGSADLLRMTASKLADLGVQLRACDGELMDAIQLEAHTLQRSAAATDDRSAEGFAHADDFTWIVWETKLYSIKKGNQAECVRALWDSWERSGRRNGCGLSEVTISEKVGSSNAAFRLVHVFRDSELWGTVIRPAGKGIYALFAESRDNHSS